MGGAWEWRPAGGAGTSERLGLMTADSVTGTTEGTAVGATPLAAWTLAAAGTGAAVEIDAAAAASGSGTLFSGVTLILSNATMSMEIDQGICVIKKGKTKQKLTPANLMVIHIFENGEGGAWDFGGIATVPLAKFLHQPTDSHTTSRLPDLAHWLGCHGRGRLCVKGNVIVEKKEVVEGQKPTRRGG